MKSLKPGEKRRRDPAFTVIHNPIYNAKAVGEISYDDGIIISDPICPSLQISNIGLHFVGAFKGIQIQSLGSSCVLLTVAICRHAAEVCAHQPSAKAENSSDTRLKQNKSPQDRILLLFFF